MTAVRIDKPTQTTYRGVAMIVAQIRTAGPDSPRIRLLRIVDGGRVAARWCKGDGRKAGFESAELGEVDTIETLGALVRERLGADLDADQAQLIQKGMF